jgi:hypothetical protein
LIVAVEALAANSNRRIVIQGETARIEVETSFENGQVSIRAI